MSDIFIYGIPIVASLLILYFYGQIRYHQGRIDVLNDFLMYIKGEEYNENNQS